MLPSNLGAIDQHRDRGCKYSTTKKTKSISPRLKVLKLRVIGHIEKNDTTRMKKHATLTKPPIQDFNSKVR